MEETRDKDYFMGLALEEARKARAKGEVPVGCVIVKEGKVIGRGHNQTETLEDPTCHGEIMAIREAVKEVVSWRLTGCDIYVSLEPCPMCMGAIMLARFDRLYIGAMNPRYGAGGSVLDLTDYQAFNHSLEVERGLREEEAAQEMKGFFRDLREEKLRKD